MIPTQREGPAGSIDLGLIRRRMEGMERDGAPALSEEEARRILEERARALAAPIEERPEELLELVVFDLASETYAVESRYVFAAFRPADIALLPGAEPPVVGLTGWRGDFLILLDLRQILGLPREPEGSPPSVLVLGEKGPAFGILVDAPRGIVELPVDAVQPLPRKSGDESSHLQGTTADAVLVIAARDLIRTYS